MPLPRFLRRDGKILRNGALWQLIPEGQTASDCDCCGCPEYKCGCYTEDPEDPECAGEWPQMWSNLSYTISGLIDTFSISWTWYRETFFKQNTFPNLCGCVERYEEQHYDFTMSGLSALNGTYGAVRTHTSKQPDFVGPCETYTTLSELSTGTGGETCGTVYDVCNEIDCYLSVYAAGVAVSGTFAKSNSFIELKDTCPDVNTSQSESYTYTGTAYAWPGLSGVAPICSNGSYRLPSLPLLIVVLGKYTGTGPLNNAGFSMFTWASQTSDPGYAGRPWTAAAPTVGGSYNPSCHTGYRALVHSPKYDCYVGDPYEAAGGMNIPALNWSNSRSTTGTPDDCPNTAGSYEEYSYAATALTATPAMSRAA